MASARWGLHPQFKKVWENWDRRRDDEAAREFYREARDACVELVLRDVLGWGESYFTDLTGALFADMACGVRVHPTTPSLCPDRPNGGAAGRR